MATSPPPIVDGSRIGLGRQSVSDRELAEYGDELRAALSEWGIAYLVNHGFGQEEKDEAFRAAKRFFEQPVDVKNSTFPRSPCGTGFIPVGKQVIDKRFLTAEEELTNYEHREGFAINDLSVPLPGDGDDGGGSLRASHESVESACAVLGARTMMALALALGLDRDFFYDRHPMLHDGSRSRSRKTYIRANFYPPFKGEVSSTTIRFGEHADYGTLTFLLQDDLPGLEVKHPTCGWVAAPPVEGAILLNVGLQLEIWTGGVLPACLHRVVVPREERLLAKPRQSLAYFICAAGDTLIKPVVNGVEGAEDRYKPVVSWPHIKELLDAANYF